MKPLHRFHLDWIHFWADLRQALGVVIQVILSFNFENNFKNFSFIKCLLWTYAEWFKSAQWWFWNFWRILQYATARASSHTKRFWRFHQFCSRTTERKKAWILHSTHIQQEKFWWIPTKFWTQAEKIDRWTYVGVSKNANNPNRNTSSNSYFLLKFWLNIS